MFIVQYFYKSLKSLTSIFELRKENIFKVFIFFILLNLILSFPANFTLIKNRGMELERFGLNLRNDIPEWFPSELPKDCFIVNEKLTCNETNLYENDYNDFTFVIDPNSTYEIEGNALVFRKSIVEFVKDDSKQEFSYSHYVGMLDFEELSNQNKTVAAERLMSGIEKEFSTSSLLFGLGIYTLSNIGMNLLFILIVSMLGMTLKFAHKSFVSYKEMVTMFVFSTTWPTLIAFLIGLTGAYPFMSVIYQFGTPIVFLLVYYRVIRDHIPLIGMEK